MSQSRLQPEGVPAGVLGRLRFDPALEAQGLSRLSDMDVDGARKAYGALLDGLNPDPDGDGRALVLLLHELLQRVNARLYRSAADLTTYHAHRGGLLAQFAVLDDPAEAREAFLPALNRLLTPLRGRAGAPHALVQRAQSLIEEGYAGRVSLSWVAQRLHVSPNYLSRLFRRVTGQTLTAFIHQVRLEQARQLLGSGGRSLSEIAYSVGYQNYRDFYRNVVKYEHASPRQVRRRLARPPEGSASA